MRFNLIDILQTIWMGFVLFALFVAWRIWENSERYLVDKSIGNTFLPRLFSPEKTA